MRSVVLDRAASLLNRFTAITSNSKLHEDIASLGVNDVLTQCSHNFTPQVLANEPIVHRFPA